MSENMFEIVIVNQRAREYYSQIGTFHKGDAGLDLYCPDDIVIPAGETVLVDLGVAVARKVFSWCPYTRFRKRAPYFLVPRSSVSKTPLMMHNSIGVIDAGYNGTLKVAFRNTGYKEYVIKSGQRLVQLIALNIGGGVRHTLVEKLSDTTRGEGGFGSTGV